MRIAVFGTGAVGGYFGGRLAQAGEEVVFIARGEHLKALNTHGLRVDSPKGDFVVQPVHATDDSRQVGVVDVVLVGVKAWQVKEAAEAMSPLVGPQTFILPLQNGLEAPAQLAAVLGDEHVLGGLCGLSSSIAGPGHIRHIDHGGEPFVRFGEMDNRPSERVGQLQQAFVGAGVTAEIPQNIQVALWMKFLFITPFSGVGSVTRAPVGVWRAIPETQQMAHQAVQEIITVAQARNIALPEDAMGKIMAMFDGLRPEVTSSMQRDVMEGRPSELEAQIGVVIRFGREAGVTTPLHAFIYNSLLPMELRARGQVEFSA
ncbi:MAG: 2-dehydropantoate 2-reductase [Anaerolineales bacterium]|nr:2-dehydropantoate 2-reductase [Anaerolineales bacterium]